MRRPQLVPGNLRPPELCRYLIRSALAGEGYQVLTADDALQGLDLIATEKIDLALLDVMMPEMDGFELLANVRRDPALMDLPVIMLTAKAQDRDVMEGWQSGADLYLTKPFNPMELLTFVKRIFDAKGEAETADKTYEIDDDVYNLD